MSHFDSDKKMHLSLLVISFEKEMYWFYCKKNNKNKVARTNTFKHCDITLCI